MKDGLYIVDHGTIFAAFVVREGEVTQCAPVLRKRFDYLLRFAEWIQTDLSIKPLTSPGEDLEIVSNEESGVVTRRA